MVDHNKKIKTIIKRAIITVRTKNLFFHEAMLPHKIGRSNGSCNNNNNIYCIFKKKDNSFTYDQIDRCDNKNKKHCSAQRQLQQYQ